jgi:hypothetical protein
MDRRKFIKAIAAAAAIGSNPIEAIAPPLYGWSPGMGVTPAMAKATVVHSAFFDGSWWVVFDDLPNAVWRIPERFSDTAILPGDKFAIPSRPSPLN